MPANDRSPIAGQGRAVGTDDVAARVDPKDQSACGARKINRTEYTPPEQEAVVRSAPVYEESDDVAASVDLVLWLLKTS